MATHSLAGVPPSMPLATDANGCLMAMSVPFRDRWIEVLAASDGQPWITWTNDRKQFPPMAEIVRDESGRILVIVQVVQTSGEIVTFELPSSAQRLPLLTLEAVVTREGHVQTSFSVPNTGLRSIAMCD